MRTILRHFSPTRLRLNRPGVPPQPPSSQTLDTVCGLPQHSRQKDGLVSILKQMPMPTMTPIEIDRISGQKPAHHQSHRGDACLQLKVKVICHKRPRKTGRFTIGQDTAKSIQIVITVRIIEKIFFFD
jgi:hypothetical protein